MEVRAGLPRSLYRLSESALPEELEEDEEVRDDTLLIDGDRDLDGDLDFADGDRTDRDLLERLCDRDLEKELEEAERDREWDADRERERLDALELALGALGFGLGQMKKELLYHE